MCLVKRKTPKIYYVQKNPHILKNCAEEILSDSL